MVVLNNNFFPKTKWQISLSRSFNNYTFYNISDLKFNLPPNKSTSSSLVVQVLKTLHLNFKALYYQYCPLFVASCCYATVSFDSALYEAAPNTPCSTSKHILATYRCIAIYHKMALCTASLMYLSTRSSLE